MKKLAFTTLLLGAFVGKLAAAGGSAEGQCAKPASAQPACAQPASCICENPYDFCNQPSCPPLCADWKFCDGKLIVGAEWLWTQVNEDNLEIGKRYTVSHIDDVPGKFIDHIHPHDNWESGFRAYAIYEFPCCAWELATVYTFLPSSQSTGRHSLDDNQFILGNFTESFSLSGLRGRWNSQLNQLDFDLSQKMEINGCFSIRPHAGFRVAWGEQKYHVESTLFSPVPFPNGLAGGTTDVLNRFKQKFHGYGLEAGLLSRWELGCGFFIVGHAGGSLLYAKFDVHSKGRDLLNNNVTVIDSENGCETHDEAFTLLRAYADSDNYHAVIPTVEYFLGFEYDVHFCGCDISAHVGWEEQVYFNLNRFTSEFSRGYGNYTASSFVLGGDVRF